MNNNYGRLLDYDPKEYIEDPYKGFKTVRRDGHNSTGRIWKFEAPEENLKLKLKESRLSFSIECESKIIPDNDLLARMTEKLDLLVNNVRLTGTNEPIESTMLAFYSNKLNYSREAQESELFLQGHFDSTTCDKEDLLKTTVKFTGLKVPEHRQSFAQKTWVEKIDKSIKTSDFGSMKYDVQNFKWKIRAPIPHGLAKQSKVFPIDTQVVLELTMARANNFLIETAEYCRVRVKKAEYDEKFTMPSRDPNLYVPQKSVTCMKLSECKCKANNERDDFTIVSIGQIPDENDALLAPIPTKEKFLETYMTGTAFVAHKTTFKTPETEKYIDEVTGEEDDTYKILFYENKLRHETAARISDLALESVLIHNPLKSESPLVVKKGVCKIPFLNYKLHLLTHNAGVKKYTSRLSQGRLPHMAIYTGMPDTRYNEKEAHTCKTKTSMYEHGFEIEELIIAIDDNPIMGTPWTTPEQFYENYLRQVGRMDNTSIAGSISFDQFVKENWMVPMHFDEHERLVGQLSVTVKFKNVLALAWRPLILMVPTEELHIDTPGNSKSIYYNFFHLFFSR